MKAGALLKATETISLPNPQQLSLEDPHQFNIQLESLRKHFWKWKVIVIELHLRQRHDVKDWRGILQLTGKVREAEHTLGQSCPIVCSGYMVEYEGTSELTKS